MKSTSMVNQWICLLLFLFLIVTNSKGDQLELTEKEILKIRKDVKAMFHFAYDGYMEFAYPFDELRPLTCDGHDTWGSYSLTLIDALDTLAVMGNQSEFQKVYSLVSERYDFDADINVSVFETNIRIVGGLLSGHLMARRMGVELEEGWPCKGPLLRLALDAATRLLPAFDTPTGMPYGTVNLRYGVPEGETPITCTAGIGTFIIEFGTLSRLTGDTIFEEAALRAMHALWQRRSRLDLIGNHIDVLTGHWTGNDAGIGAGVDSYFEYLAKGSFLFQRPELIAIFKKAREAIDLHLRHEDWYLWKSMQRAQVTMAVFQSLEAFWPGILTLVGDVDAAQRTLFNYHQVMKQYGFTPEFYNIPQGIAYSKRSGYPLRPEFIESLVYLYQATRDHTFLKMGADLVRTIEHSTKTKCGYATVENVVDHSLDNRMESFFLAETTKYLYLLFHEDHWLHSSGDRGRPFKVGKRHCVIEAGGYFFNSEAHPIDSGALACCTGPEENNWFLPQEDLINLILDPSTIPPGNAGKPLKSILNKGRKRMDGENRGSENDFVKTEENTQQSVTVNPQVEVETQMSPKKEFNYTIHLNPPSPTEAIPPVENVLNEQTKQDSGNAEETIVVKNTDGSIIVKSKGEIIEINPVLEVSPHSETSGDKIEADSNGNKSEYDKGNIVSIINEYENPKEKDEEKLPWGPRFTSFSERVETEGRSQPPPPVSELSGVSTSVSSSKSSPRITENRIIPKEEEESKPPPRIFSLSGLKERLQAEMYLLANVTEAYCPSLLSCSASSFVESISFKGQMLSP